MEDCFSLLIPKIQSKNTMRATGKMIRSMDMAATTIPMAQSTAENGAMARIMAEANSPLQTVLLMMDFGSTIRCTATVFIWITWVENGKESSEKAYLKAADRWS